MKFFQPHQTLATGSERRAFQVSIFWPGVPKGSDTATDERQRRLMAMLYFGLWTVDTRMGAYDEGFARLWRHEASAGYDLDSSAYSST